MAALAATPSTLAKPSDGEGNRSALTTREERIAAFQNSVLAQAKKCGVLVMKNSTEQTKTLTLPSIRTRPEQQLGQEAALEVLSLSNQPSGTDRDLDGASVMERITTNRKERHEKTVEDMKQELTQVSNELELRMTKASEQLQQNLTANDEVLLNLFQKIDTTEQLQSYSLHQLNNLWDEITDQTAIRIGCIKTLDAELGSVEEDRIKTIEAILKSYGAMLGHIAYMLPEDVNRLITDEAQAILGYLFYYSLCVYLLQAVNLAVLSNKRKYVDLYLHLMIVEIEREKEHRTRWEDKVDEWKKLMRRMAEEQFRIYMKSDLVCNPTEVNKLKEFLVAEQKSMNRKRLDLVHQLSTLSPPDVTKLMVEDSHKMVARLHRQLEELHNKFLVQLQNIQEVVNMACLNEIERHREELVEMGACDIHTAYKLVGQSFMKLVEEHQSRNTNSLKTIEKQLDEVLIEQQEKFQHLYQLAHGAASTWDEHRTTLTTMEQELIEALEECRSEHNVTNQQLETKLDVVLAMMREGSTDEALSHQMNEANSLLEQILQGYVHFHSTMKDKSLQHPSDVKEELSKYDTALCQYLGVSRDPPVQKKPKRQIRSIADQKSRKATVATIRTDSRKTATIAPLESRLSKATTLAHIPVAVELVETFNGTVYYVCDPSVLGDAPPQKSDDPSDKTQPDNIFLTQDEESELSTCDSPMTENLSITDDTFYDAKKRIRKEYLEQLESWKVSLVAKLNDELASKEEEFATEMDLRLHLHEPRQARITQDIHNVRASELIAHRERLSRHIQGTNTELSKYKSNIATLNNLLQTTYEELLNELRRAEDQLQVSTSLTELYKVEQDVKHIIDQHKAWLAHTTDSYQSFLEAAANDLSSANANFRSSLKLFSNGGNYCREEVEFFDKKLDRLTSKIRTAHTNVVNEVGAALLAQQEQVTKKLQEFVERFSVHEVDLKFLDKLSNQLTHTQVQIKTEVAASNSKSQELLQMIHTLKEDCATCQHPTPDKPAVTPTGLMDSLPVVFKACSTRVEYLHCSMAAHKVPSKVGFLTEPSSTAAGTTTAPISAVNVTKSILEYVTAKRQFASEPNFDANRSLIVPHSPLPYSSQESARTVSITASSNEDRKVSRQGKKKKEEKLIDRKNVKYGSAGGDDKTDALLPKMRRTLRESHLNLYKTCEQYYRAKGTSPSTRPDEIPETFEFCMDSLIERLHSYQIQAEEYRRECIDEFNIQLKELLCVLNGLPMVVLSSVATQHTTLCHDDCEQLNTSHRNDMDALLAEQKQHRTLLRPALGHPNNAKELIALRTQELDRHRRVLDTIDCHFLAMQAKESKHLESFVDELVDKTQSLLHVLDDCVTVDDVISGGNKYGERLELEQLLRQHIQQEISSDATVGGTKTKTSIDWPPLPPSDVLLKPKPSVTACPKSKKSTSVHSAVIVARDKLYQDRVSKYEERLRQLENMKKDEEINEQKWLSSWTSSVEQVILLYK